MLNVVVLGVVAPYVYPWTNLIQQENTRAEFSTLDENVLVYAMQFC